MLRFFWAAQKNAPFRRWGRHWFMDHRQKLRGDCAACQGLCCVALSFERSEWFAFDKLAHQPCPKLERAGTCAIHRRLVGLGQAGCARYDCYGAGQRACQLLAGTSWRDGPEQAARMFSTFARLKEVHELRLLLREAARLALTPAHEAERGALLAELEPAEDFSAATLAAIDLHTIGERVRSWLRGLRRNFSEPMAARRLRVLPSSR